MRHNKAGNNTHLFAIISRVRSPGTADLVLSSGPPQAVLPVFAGLCLIWGSGAPPRRRDFEECISSKQRDSGSVGESLLLEVSELRQCLSPFKGLF